LKTIVKLKPEMPAALSPNESRLVQTLLYFGMFRYPLRKAELELYQPPGTVGCPELEELLYQNLICEKDGLWGLQSQFPQAWSARKAGEENARNLWPSAQKTSRLLSRIPFVRCVCVSGSLSKNAVDPEGDIDFFIIVQKNRLWLVRFIFSAVVLFLKIRKKKHLFCPNYLMVDNNLEVKDRSRYTAVEIRSLVPMYNSAVFHRFLATNRWISAYVDPEPMPEAFLPLERKHKLAILWNSWLMDGLDELVFRLYYSYYLRKFGLESLSSQSEIRFSRNVLKLHNSGHRRRILEQFEQELLRFETETGRRFTH
jgi:hypothetical protein